GDLPDPRRGGEGAVAGAPPAGGRDRAADRARRQLSDAPGRDQRVPRQITTALVVERMLRGVPVIYADMVDYDEIAHHAGPQRGESLGALDGVDHVLGMLERVVDEAPRPYRFVVLSDH